MILYIIISFFLENVVGLLFNNSFIIPLFFLVSLITLYQFKNMDYEKYLFLLTILGFIYDIVYTNIYINSLLFLIVGSLVVLYSKYISNSFLLNLLAVFLSLIVYESVYYYIYILLGLNDFSLSILIKSLISTIPINVGYYILSYLCLNKVKAGR